MSLIGNAGKRRGNETRGMVRDITTAAVGIAGISLMASMIKK